MKDIMLPARIMSKRSELTELQQMFLDCYLLGVGNPKQLFHLMLAIGKTEVMSNSMMRALLNSTDGKDYLESRRKQIEEHFFGKSVHGEDEDVNSDMTMKESQEMIVRHVLSDLAVKVKTGELDYRSSAIVETAMKKALEISAETLDAPEPPRIYLPENCSNCRYRVACESEEVVDDCKWCKYRKSCNERGEVYDQKTQLDIPDEERNTLTQ